MSAPKETPLMKQYNTIKEKYPDAILLFRVGDFYETFDNDAVTASKVLGITLTKRNNGAAMSSNLAGFPHHSLDTYLPKLVKAGYRVAICDQLEDPKMTKTIVKRGVTELVTPGVTVNDKILNHQTNNFLCSIAYGNEEFGIAFIDISTGEFLVSQGNKAHIEKLIQSFQPAEIIFSKKYQVEFSSWFDNRYYTFMVDDWVYQYDTARELLLRHFETASLKGFGIEELQLAVVAAGATMHYLKSTEHNQLQHINAVQRIAEDKYVWLDRFTIRNLELIDSPFHDGVPLIKVIDKTQSPMGARMMRRWLLLPLKEAKPIEERLAVVDYFLRTTESDLSGGAESDLKSDSHELLISNPQQLLSNQIQQLGDLERLISKVPMARVTPREVVQLKKSLYGIETIKKICTQSNQTTLQKWADQLNPCLHIRNRIEKEILPEPPALANRGGVIASGVHEQLDELRNISSSSKDYLLKIQQKAAEETGITTLKISFNNVFGYYLEVTNSHKNKVPASWIRKQTLTNAERYITEELKVFEEKILGAEEKISAIEQQLFEQLVKDLAEFVQPIQLNATVLAQLDCLISFATVAVENNYVKPHLAEDGILQIKDGRHPVIEKQLPVGEGYVPNDIYLDRDTQQIIIITGPNMAGKSALLRQTALIVLLAQAGSFVPATQAQISLVDKIFTRVGASDNISSGESTFMVEMNETASILNNISNDSLVLLDEIGRGTSTYDGISIAWSIAEYLHNHPLYKPKTLFATHYHELTELSDVYPKIKNFNVSVHEHEGKIIFLRKLKQGGSQHSFGIQVAKMAGMPQNLIQRANEMMHQLESKSLQEQNRQQLRSVPTQQMQLNIFDPVSDEMKEILQQLKMLDINKTTPVEALMKLIELKGMVRR